jgi:hypothetical protein
LSFWFFTVSDGFFIGDAGFFVGPIDFFWMSTGFSDNVAIFFRNFRSSGLLELPLGLHMQQVTKLRWMFLMLASHATSYKITLAVFNVGFSLGFGFLSEIML